MLFRVPIVRSSLWRPRQQNIFRVHESRPGRFWVSVSLEHANNTNTYKLCTLTGKRPQEGQKVCFLSARPNYPEATSFGPLPVSNVTLQTCSNHALSPILKKVTSRQATAPNIISCIKKMCFLCFVWIIQAAFNREGAKQQSVSLSGVWCVCNRMTFDPRKANNSDTDWQERSQYSPVVKSKLGGDVVHHFTSLRTSPAVYKCGFNLSCQRFCSNQHQAVSDQRREAMFLRLLSSCLFRHVPAWHLFSGNIVVPKFTLSSWVLPFWLIGWFASASVCSSVTANVSQSRSFIVTCQNFLFSLWDATQPGMQPLMATWCVQLIQFNQDIWNMRGPKWTLLFWSQAKKVDNHYFNL